MFFDQALRSAISRADRNPAVQIALLNIDLDGFKNINDGHGHAAGDHVLKTIAARFAAAQRVTDVVCRLGGDEFAWIIEGAMPLRIDTPTRKITTVVELPIEYGRTELLVGCSIGVALSGKSVLSFDALCEEADAAMYAMKKSRQ